MSFAYYKTCTIDHTKCGSGDSSNFPVLISVTDADLKTVGNGGFVQNSSGYDVVPYADSGLTTKLDHEIERYVSSTGEVVFWVRLPTVSHSADTVFYLAFGDVSISTSQENKTGVWDAGFICVLHLPDGSTLAANDSTGNAENGTIHGSVTAVAGRLGPGAAAFPGSATNYISVPSATPTHVTISAWVKSVTGADSSEEYIVNKNYDGSSVPFSLNLGDASGVSGVSAGFSFFDGAWHQSGIVTDIHADNIWHLIVGTYDGTTLRYFIDGSQDASSGYVGSLPSSTLPIDIGRYGNNAKYLKANLDELRISNIARNADWILTEFNNQNSPSTFISLGVKTSIGGSTTTVTPGTASLTLTSFAPKVVTTTRVVPATKSLALATFAPTIKQAIRVIPGPASLVLNSFAPRLVAQTRIVPATAHLTLGTFAPTSAVTNRINIPTAALVLNAFAPTVIVFTAGQVVITPQTATLALTSFAPNLIDWSDVNMIVVQKQNRIIAVQKQNRIVLVPKQDRIVKL